MLTADTAFAVPGGLPTAALTEPHGFLRLRCADCGQDKLLAFSCKRRGFCPSYGARRMSQRLVCF